MRKLMDMVDYDNDEAYIAAKLYLNATGSGAKKPEIAKQLSYKTTVGFQAAILMIDAIDAYEDLREAPDEWKIAEDSTDIQYPDYEDEGQEYWLNIRTMKAFKIPSAFVDPDKMSQFERKRYIRVKEVI